MAKKQKTDVTVASVLSFEKKLVPSDAFLYGAKWDTRHSDSKPLSLIEKSVRGTISNRLKDAVKKDPMKLNAEVEKANLQRVDSCSLERDQDTLKLSFTLKVLSGIEKPSACNNEDFNNSYALAARRYVESEGFKELSKRYAINIANARYLWRNRVGAEKIEVVVTIEDEKLIFKAHDFSLKSFDSNNENIKFLAGKIADALSGNIPYLLIKVDAYALVGNAQEVYPSEELVLDKGKSDKSKILYSVSDVAAMHSQKVGNALRTIDTWYPNCDDLNIGPIAIEIYGAVTSLGKAYRHPSEKADFYTLFDNFSLNAEELTREEEHYVMAVLVRGGVFGQSSKE